MKTNNITVVRGNIMNIFYTLVDKISKYSRLVLLLCICSSTPILCLFVRDLGPNLGKNPLAKTMNDRNLNRAEMVKRVKEILSKKTFPLEGFAKDNAEVNIPINFHGDTPLHQAVFYGSKELVTLLVNAGANPNIPHKYKFTTPLDAARSKGRLDLVAIMEKKEKTMPEKEEAPEDATFLKCTPIE